MDELRTLQALGFELPGPGYIIGAILFGLIGLLAFRHGRRHDRPRSMWLGVALMLYPYAISQTWLLYLVGAGLCGAIYLDRE